MVLLSERRLTVRAAVVLGTLSALVLPRSTQAADEATPPVTWSQHIAAIVWKNCAGCHRPGEVGPFSLLSYEDAAKRADFIAEVAESRQMPPWKAEPGFGKFHDERRLSDDEIKLLAQWAAAGAPQGDAKHLPPAPKFSDGWQLGKPDLVLKMERPFEVPAEGRDIYRSFVIPIPAEKDQYVTAVEFRPGNRKVVHHAIMYLDANGAARIKDAEDEEPGFITFGGPGILPTGGLGSWTPGAMPRALAEGTVRYVQKGSDLVLQVHYHPSGKTESDQSLVGIYLSKKPPKHIVTGIAVMQPGLELPAGQARCEVKAKTAVLPVDVQVLGLSPHMHYLGREFKVTATCPGKSEEVPLVWIKDWDFNWQGAYHFAEPLELPKGSVINVVSVYDNSADNPRNPNSPPQTVKWGEQTTDEMCLCGIQVVTDKQADLKRVVLMPGNELGAALEGGIPGLARLVKSIAGNPNAKKPTGRKLPPELAGKLPPELAAAAEAGAIQAVVEPQIDPSAQLTKIRQRSSAAEPEADEGTPIPEDAKRLLNRFDTDHDGKLTRKEIRRMPSGMQAYSLRVLGVRGK